MEKFQNKYRIPSARLVGWDYATDAAYFITICTANRTHFFGECVDGKMKLSTAGAIVQGFWYEIPTHFPFVLLGEFTVMPNHIHGILILDKTNFESSGIAVSPESVETWQCHVSTATDNKNDEPPKKNEFFSKISPKSGSISTILGSFKSVCTKHINLAFPDLKFDWQERFWDNIIRDDVAFENISNYIINNPKNWKEDKFFDENNE